MTTTKTRTQKKPNWKLQNAKPSKHNEVEKVVNESKHREQRRENLWVLVSKKSLWVKRMEWEKKSQISSSLFFKNMKHWK